MRAPLALSATLVVVLSSLALTCSGKPAGDAPTVVTTSPSAAATGVPLNAKLSATFSLAMMPLSSASLALKAGATPVQGVVVMSPDEMTAVFTPASALAANTTYTASVTTDAKSTGGMALATASSWSFTTGTSTDTTAPTVTATTPIADAQGVPINTHVVAVFSESLDPGSITSSSFTVTHQGAVVAGTLGTAGSAATFLPTSTLPLNTVFTVTLTTAVKDLTGNALGANVSWSFTTGSTARSGPMPVNLGAAGNFAVLAKTGVSSVPASVITGAVGLGPAAASYLTGFSLVADASNVFSTSPQVTGRLYAADYAPPTPTNLTVAVGNMESAYTDAETRPTPDFLELGSGDLGGRTLVPGLYKWTSSLTMPSAVMVAGAANDVWIFQTSGDLSMSTAMQVTLSGGAQARNIFWQVAGHVTLGAGAHLEGIVLCHTDVTLQTGATVNGRLLSGTQVALQQATVTEPTP